MFHCGGVLVAPDVVLTAGHCDMDPGDTLHVSGYEWGENGSGAHIVEVLEEIVHPEFNRYTFVYDFALIRINNSIDLESDVRLAMNSDPSYPEVGETLTVAGMGQTQYQGSNSPILQDVDVQRVANEDCDEMLLGEVTSSMLCAGVEDGSKDSCTGDSGGPLVIRDGNIHTLVGLVSWGHRCAVPNTAGVYGRVSAAMDWIVEVVCRGWQTSAEFCPGPTESPTSDPTDAPTSDPTDAPTSDPTHAPTTSDPTDAPTSDASHAPTVYPTHAPTFYPTHAPTSDPTHEPTSTPTRAPTSDPTHEPIPTPTHEPIISNCSEIEIQLMTDRWPEENSYYLIHVDKSRGADDPDATTLVWNKTSFIRSTEYYRDACLPGYPNETCAIFNFSDTFGDGLYDYGYLMVIWEGRIVLDEWRLGFGVELQLGDGCDSTTFSDQSTMSKSQPGSH